VAAHPPIDRCAAVTPSQVAADRLAAAAVSDYGFFRRGKMILTTHAIVGGALASLFPSHPVAAIAAGFASHFAIDAIPHWDYPLHSISVAPGHRNKLKLDRPQLQDLALIGFDGFAGLALAVGFFATRATVFTIVLGALAAMLPDALQFVHSLFRCEPLNSLQRFHRWIHTKHRLDWPIGVSSQIAFVATVIGTMPVLR
jgi:hypothetical protein